MSELDDINTIEQTAEYLKIETTKLRRLVNQKKIAFLKQGHVLTFPRAAVEAYVESNTTAAIPPNTWGLTDASARRIRGR
ncbi:helix-turn-helix domain-containing protein [Cryobacterium sp. HLT2-28]|uniref:helix-turn-helix domain-containing protein n=1 Tax=Cryobacterium sp. HLT2-28 TaxID=1259146 RepID=UPI00141AA440|nr:helix-turn-helix domain-containing protein [Cryobacterium sp. HLT2-28]